MKKDTRNQKPQTNTNNQKRDWRKDIGKREHIDIEHKYWEGEY